MHLTLFIYEPLDQFEIIFLTYINGYPLTNSILYMIFSYIVFRYIFKLSLLKGYSFTPNNWQSFTEIYYNFILNLIKQQINDKSFSKYFPIIFSLFSFLLISNILGMTLYSFTITSHIILTFSLSISLFIGIIILGFLLHKINFIYIFVPGNAPKLLLPFLIIIEIISYFSRPFSLAIRLFANMMSGHTLLAILGNFTFILSKTNFLISLIPFILITAIVGLELMIAALQAYVFTVLICIYINDSIQGGH